MSKRTRTTRKPPAQPSFNYARLPTPQLVETLRSFANLRPSVDLLLSAVADRLDAYHKMVELGTTLSAGTPVTTYECDLTNVTDETIANALGAVTAALRDAHAGAQAVVLPHSQDARKAAMRGDHAARSAPRKAKR